MKKNKVFTSRSKKACSKQFNNMFDLAYCTTVSKRIERTFDRCTHWADHRLAERLDYSNCLASYAVGIPHCVKSFQKGD